MKLNAVIFASHFCQWPASVFDNGFWVFNGFSISGYNITNLAYGQTGSGKTHLMGTAYTEDSVLGETLRAINDIFFTVKEMES